MHAGGAGAFSAYPASGILLQDSTQIRLHGGNAEHFKGVGNSAGCTASAKFDMISDLVSGALLPSHLSEGRHQDRANGPRIFELLEPGDLVLRDMGYFDVEDFARIEQVGANWISRLHSLAHVSNEQGTCLEELLRRCEHNTLDLDVTLTRKGHKARLIAVRATREVTERRRAKTRERRKRMGNTATKRSLEREGWSLYVTDLCADQFSLIDIVTLYEGRWDVEIRFRALKGSTRLRELFKRRTSKTALRVLLCAVMVFAHIGAKAFQWLRPKSTPARPPSTEKVYQWLANALLSIAKIDAPIPYDIRALCLESRKRPTLRTRTEPLF